MQPSIINSLREIVGSASVLTSLIEREAYAFDSSPYFGLPDAVVFPHNTDEVSRVMQLAYSHRIPVVPRGAGTNLSGGSVPIKGGIALVLTKMNRILEIDIENETALVEPGVVNLDLQRALEPYKYIFAPDPSSQKAATIGGNVGECAGGIRGVKYGVTKNHILGLEVVLPDGSIITTGGLLGEAYPDIDLTWLMVGSEGTLGIATKILCKLTRQPEAVQTVLSVFNSLEKAGDAVSEIIARGIVPPTLEIMDRTLTRAVDDFIQLGLPRDAEAILLIEVDGYQEEIKRQIDVIIEVLQKNGAQSWRSAASAAERETLWLGRRSVNGTIGRLRPAYVVQDVTVPRDRLPEMLERVAAIGIKYGITIAQVAHAGDGNLHPHLLYQPGDQDEISRVEQASEELFHETLASEGTLTGEHGIGLEKRRHMKDAFTPDTLEFMHKLKTVFDPTGLLNPDKLLPEREQS
ncbi:MAG: FAD-binding oxidoreductase [Bacillota bacterium]